MKRILSQVQLKEGEKQLTLWQKRLTTMKKLKAGFDSSGDGMLSCGRIWLVDMCVNFGYLPTEVYL